MGKLPRIDTDWEDDLENSVCCANRRKNRSPESTTQLDATLDKCREIELASSGNAALQEQERRILPENEQDRQLNRLLALTPYNQRVTKT